jgi:AcrR family transcriptional regulator
MAIRPQCESMEAMPKRVDPRERRRRIADALMRVAGEHGLEAVSLRHVAAEAGATTGMVQHYFRTKDEMVLFALQAVSDNSTARIEAAVAALGAAPTPRDLLRAMFLEILPLDQTRRADGRVALAFLAYAAVRPAVAEAQRRSAAGLRDFVADQIRAAGRTDDPVQAATTLTALVEGLGIHLLSDVYPPETAVAALDAQLDAVFGR